MTTATITTIRPKAPLTEIQFCAWVAQALPGDRLEYHRGFLVLDTFPGLSYLAIARPKTRGTNDAVTQLAAVAA